MRNKVDMQLCYSINVNVFWCNCFYFYFYILMLMLITICSDRLTLKHSWAIGTNRNKAIYGIRRITICWYLLMQKFCQNNKHSSRILKEVLNKKESFLLLLTLRIFCYIHNCSLFHTSIFYFLTVAFSF